SSSPVLPSARPIFPSLYRRASLRPSSFPARRTSDLALCQHFPVEIEESGLDDRGYRAGVDFTEGVVFTHVGRDTARVEAHLGNRSEEHTSELQSRENLVCRLLLENKNSHVDSTGAVS